MKPLTDWCYNYAIFFDKLGHYVGRKKLHYNNNTFNFLNGSYNFIPSKSSYFKDTDYIGINKYYFYQMGIPEPIILKMNVAPAIINSEDYGTLLNSDILNKLNSLGKGKWFIELLTPFNITIAVIIFGFLYYFFTIKGGKLW